jgi:hypothetical protein
MPTANSGLAGCTAQLVAEMLVSPRLRSSWPVSASQTLIRLSNPQVTSHSPVVSKARFLMHDSNDMGGRLV